MGFGFGGMMSNAVGCALADTFRAVAPMSGSLWCGCESGTHPIAAWGAHGTVIGVETATVSSWPVYFC